MSERLIDPRRKIGRVPHTLPQNFAKDWLEYKEEREFVAFYFYPDRPGEQEVACDDGEQVYCLGYDEKYLIIGLVLVHFKWLREHGFQIGHNEKATHWLVLDTRANVMFVAEKDLAYQWIESQLEPIVEII